MNVAKRTHDTSPPRPLHRGVIALRWWAMALSALLSLPACDSSTARQSSADAAIPLDDVEGDDESASPPDVARAPGSMVGVVDSGASRDAAVTTGEPQKPGTVVTDDAGIDPSAELYDPALFPRFDLELPDASIAALNMVSNAEDPRQNTYVTATLKYGDEQVGNIGVRLKGEGSFQQLAQKPALKLKFDEFVSKQSFRGLRRMTLNNAFEDPSFVAERLAYELFRAAGLPAPRCNNATLYINGTFYGVYVNVEAEDKTFLRRWFADDSGNLYEEGQKDFVRGAESAFNLETNETVNDRTDLRALIAALEGATSATLLADLGKHLDTTQFLRFTAAEAAVNQWDMYAYTVFYVNNLRLYSDPGSGRFSFIPWGMDLSMKPFRDSGKPYVELFALARQGTRANGAVSAGLIFQRCLESASCRSAYRESVREIIGVYEELGLEARAQTYYQQIRSQVMADTRKRVCCSRGMLTNQQFEAGFQSVLTTVRGRVAALRAELAAP